MVHFVEYEDSIVSMLLKRRSTLVERLSVPGPNERQLKILLTIASRVPDHGKLAHWRFVVISGDKQMQLGQRVAEIFASKNPAASSEEIATEKKYFSYAPVIIAVISRAKQHPKIPIREQELSAAACCTMLLTASGAMGFDAIWVTGWASQDTEVLKYLGVEITEKIFGFIHIGTANEKLEERRRPNLDDIVSYL